MGFRLDDGPAGFRPRLGLIPEGRKESLRLARFLVLPQGLLQDILALAFEHRIHAQTQGIVKAEFLAEGIRLWEPGNPLSPRRLIWNIRPHGAEPLDQISQIVLDSQCGRGSAKKRRSIATWSFSLQVRTRGRY